MKYLLPLLLAAAALPAHAATDAEVKAAFDKAQKKGAVAIVEQRCGGTTTVSFPGASAASIAKTAAALSAMGALAGSGAHDGGVQDCGAGMHEGDARMLDLYPDGTVKPH